MAEQQPTKKKRRIRPSSAQSIRERTAQAQMASAEPKQRKFAGIRSGMSGFFAPLRFIGHIVTWLGRHLIPRYFRNAFKELRLVNWPNWKQTRQLTTAVILFAIVFALFIATLDFGLDKVFKRILLK